MPRLAHRFQQLAPGRFVSSLRFCRAAMPCLEWPRCHFVATAMQHRLSVVAVVVFVAAVSAYVLSAAPARVDCSAAMALAGAMPVVTLR